jgi:pimeloyl-ACP methyl ester carboxylesterase
MNSTIPGLKMFREKNLCYYISAHNIQQDWLIMVHGFTQNHALFNRQVAYFQENYQLLLIDLRGHGNSADHPGPFGVEEYTDDLEYILNSAGIEHASYWGTHTGAAIGLAFVNRQPKRIKSLIMEGAVIPGFDMPSVTSAIQEAKRTAISSGVNAALKIWFDNAGWFDIIRKKNIQCRCREHKNLIYEFTGNPWITGLIPRETVPVMDILASIRQPVLLYNGEFDLDDFKKAAAILEESLPRVRRLVIEEAGGFPCWEYPDVVNASVSEFLLSLHG